VSSKSEILPDILFRLRDDIAKSLRANAQRLQSSVVDCALALRMTKMPPRPRTVVTSLNKDVVHAAHRTSAKSQCSPFERGLSVSRNFLWTAIRTGIQHRRALLHATQKRTHMPLQNPMCAVACTPGTYGATDFPGFKLRAALGLLRTSSLRRERARRPSRSLQTCGATTPPARGSQSRSVTPLSLTRDCPASFALLFSRYQHLG
jgi:hypothetical protein